MTIGLGFNIRGRVLALGRVGVDAGIDSAHAMISFGTSGVNLQGTIGAAALKANLGNESLGGDFLKV